VDVRCPSTINNVFIAFTIITNFIIVVMNTTITTIPLMPLQVPSAAAADRFRWRCAPAAFVCEQNCS
jgi:hypothetical protein